MNDVSTLLKWHHSQKLWQAKFSGMLYLLQDWEQAYCVHNTKIFIFIIKLINIDQETSKVEGAKSALPQYYRAPKYRGYIGLKNAKKITCRVKNSTYRVMVHIWLKIAKCSIYSVKKMQKNIIFGPSLNKKSNKLTLRKTVITGTDKHILILYILIFGSAMWYFKLFFLA